MKVDRVLPHFQRPLKAIALATSAIHRAFMPFLVCWPWLVALLAFNALLSTSQGVAIARDTVFSGRQAVVVFALVLGASMLVAFGCLLTLVAWWANQRRSETDNGKTSWVGAGGIAALLLSTSGIVLLAWATGSGAMWLATVIAYMGVGALVWRAWRATGTSDSWSARALRFTYRHRLWLATLTAAAAFLPLLAGGLLVQARPMALSELGPLVVGLLGFQALATAFAAIVIAIPLCLGLRWLGVLLIAGLFVWSASGPAALDMENPLLSKERQEAFLTQLEKKCKRPPTGLVRSIAQRLPVRPKAGQANAAVAPPQPMYLISAEGGGIRAAYWAAVALTAVDIETDDLALANATTVSGVSGGSLGVATWMAARERKDLTPQQRLELVRGYLRSDFLSPLLGGLLLLDAPRVLLGPFWFSARRDHVFEKALADQWKALGQTDFFHRPWRYPCIQGFENPPAVFFNATDALTGSPVPISTTAIGEGSQGRPWPRTLATSTLGNATVAQVVHVSARFPYLSPAADVGVNASEFLNRRLSDELDKQTAVQPISETELDRIENEQFDQVEALKKEGLVSRIAVLVDGGYLDNTATAPSLAVLKIIRERREREAKRPATSFKPYSMTPVRVLHLSNDPGRACEPLSANWQDQLTRRARRYVKVTQQTLACIHEVDALERSLAPAVWQWLLAPLDAVLLARNRQSSAQWLVAEREATVLNGNYSGGVAHLSIETELRDMRGELSSHLALRPNPVQTSQTVVMTRNLLQSTKPHLSPAVLKGFEEQISKYLHRVQTLDQKIGCQIPDRSHSPPLGWMLDKASREALDCLATRAAIRNGFGYPELPQLPEMAISNNNPYIPR